MPMFQMAEELVEVDSGRQGQDRKDFISSNPSR